MQFLIWCAVASAIALLTTLFLLKLFSMNGEDPE